jgi:hypothetical protein
VDLALGKPHGVFDAHIACRDERSSGAAEDLQEDMVVTRVDR